MSEYFVGSGAMNPFLIGVSLFATLLSTITYLSIPGEVAGKGPMYIMTLLALPFVFPMVAYVLLPVYMKTRVTSAYELLETRLGLSIRLIGVAQFLALRLVWMSLLIYLMAKAMSKMMDLDESAIPWIVLVIGFVSVTYTALGGLRAVVITDLVQTMLMFGGAILVVIMISIDMGGFSWFPTTWQPHWDVQPLYSFDPSTRLTVLGTFFNIWIWYVCTAGGDQLSVQRFMATKDVKAARRAYAIQLCASTAITLILFLVGFAVMGYFNHHPEFLPAGYDLKVNADDLYPRFISHHLPMGISGLVISAMFAAAMSSVDSGVNSITAVVMTDLMDRFGKKPTTEKGHVRAATILAFTIGGLVMIGSAFVGNIEGNITEVCSKTANLLVTPIFGLFFFALFVKCANAPGVWVGWFFGTAAAVLTAFSGEIFGWDPITGNPPISFEWIPLISITINLVTGYIACIIFASFTKPTTAPA
ncbi:MAG: sodium/solute symporter [Candidatus Hydrogenedentes bacterium]|nr:sodium/solute symporter [Candidatus Hydrogenedentota bacterium]